MLVLTGYNDAYAHIGAVTTPGKKAYAERHGWPFHCQRHYTEHPSWAKLGLVLDLLQHHDQILWLDADTIITDPAFDPQPQCQPGLNVSTDWNPADTEPCFSLGNFLITRAARPLFEQARELTEYSHGGFYEQTALRHLYHTRPELRHLFTIHRRRLFNAVDGSLRPQAIEPWQVGDWLCHLTADRSEQILPQAARYGVRAQPLTAPVTLVTADEHPRPVLTAPRVLFVNNHLANCGVNDYGRRVFRILSQTAPQLYWHIDCGGVEDYRRAYHEIRPDVVLWNHQAFNINWLTTEVVDQTPARHIALAHLVHPQAAHSVNYREFHAILSQDPTTPTTMPKVFPVPRPLLPTRPATPPPARTTIGSFGFAYRGKRFDLLVELICQQFEDCLIRLHMPPGSGDPAGTTHNANQMAQHCRELIRRADKPNIELEATHHYLSYDDLVTWLSGNTLNALWYEDNIWGVSSCLDPMLEANRPIAISKSQMFRHLHEVQPKICLEERPLAEIIAAGPELLEPLRQRWSTTQFTAAVERVAFGPLPHLVPLPSNRVLTHEAKAQEHQQLLHDWALHVPSCPLKAWDLLIALSYLRDGDLFDMGSASSMVLPNAMRLGLRGDKYGMDLTPDPSGPGYTQLRGDFLETRFPKQRFDFITCLSVLEHGVDLERFAQETGRLLRRDGILTVSFDYWDPKRDTAGLQIFNRPWTVFSRADTESFIRLMATAGLHLTSPVDFTQQDEVIRPGQWAPSHFGYTFACLTFIKE